MGFAISLPAGPAENPSKIDRIRRPNAGRQWRQTMARQRANQNKSKDQTGISLRQLKKELKLIPNDIKREVRFLDLLFAERNFLRTEAEREVVKDFIDSAKQMAEFHQNRLERYQACYDQLKTTKVFDLGLLLPDELKALQSGSSSKKELTYWTDGQRFRTGTDG